MKFINMGTDFTAYVGAEDDLFEDVVQPATILLFSNQNNAKVTIDPNGRVTVQKGSRQWFDAQVGQAQGIGKPFDTSGHSSPVPVDGGHVGGDPNATGRPPGEEPPPNMTGGGKPIRGGGQPGGTTSNPKGDDDGDGVKNRNDRFPNDPSRS